VNFLRVGLDGLPLGPARVLVGNSDALLQLAVASDGTNYLVAWSSSVAGGISMFATRVTADGAVLDSGGFLISGAVNPVDFAVSGRAAGYLLAWLETRGAPFNILGTLLTDAAGQLGGPPLVLVPSTMYAQTPCLTGDDVGFLVTFMNDISTQAYVTVALDGGASGTTSFSANSTTEIGPEACASGGGNAYATYANHAAVPARTEVCRVLTDGGCEITPLGQLWDWGSVLWTGSEAVFIAQQSVDAGTLLQAISLDGGGAVEWSAVVPGQLSDLAVAQGRILATYQRFEPLPPYDAMRTYFEVLSPGVDGSVPTDAGLDGGASDAGSPDAGLMKTVPDAGAGCVRLLAVGCGCETGFPAGAALLMLAVLSFVRRRSRR
jgi:MYXO-CTERM domain-containing protein